MMEKIELPDEDRIYFDPKEESKEIKKLKDKIKAVEFRDEVNDNEFLDENDVGAYSKRGHSFWKVFGVLCFIFVFALTIFIIYLGYHGNLNNLINPSFNNTFNNEVFLENQYNITSTTDISNQYEHEIYNNFSIYVNNMGCNCS